MSKRLDYNQIAAAGVKALGTPCWHGEYTNLDRRKR
jgi:hypothetical protein